MKTLVLISLLFGSQTFAVPVNFKCVSLPPTTSFVVQTVVDKTVVDVIHHNGIKYMPIHTGTITPSDTEYLAEKAKVLTKLGDHVTFEFPSARCKQYGEKVFSCSGGSKVEIDGVEYEATGLHTGKITSEVFDYRFEAIRTVLAIWVGGRMYDIEMSYDTSFCQF